MDRVFPMSLFRREVAKILAIKDELLDADLSIVLSHLARDMGLVAYNTQVCLGLHQPFSILINVSQVVVFKRDEDTVPKLSDQHVAVAGLKSLIVELQGQHDAIQARVATLDEKAGGAAATNNRSIALAALKSKKLSEKALEQRAQTILQLEELHNQIEHASDQIALIHVMKSSTSVLRGLHKDLGGIENVEDVVEKLKEESQNVDDINDMIQAAGQELSHVDEDAVDDELDCMLREASESREQEREAQRSREELAKLDTIPNSPRSDPGVKATKSLSSAPLTLGAQSQDLVSELGRVSLNETRSVDGSSERSSNMAHVPQNLETAT